MRTAPRSERKALLMVDYYFPPAGGAAVQRTLGLASWLPVFGWDPIVLTSRDPEHVHRDASLHERIPASVRVERTYSVEPVRFAKRVLEHHYLQRDGIGWRAYRRPWYRSRQTFSRLAQLLFFPDRHVGWLPFAVARGLSMLRRRAFDAIYSTSTSVTSHLVARVLKRLSGKFWIADFQDPWSENEIIGLPVWPHRVLATRLEHLILRDADRVTVTTRPIGEMFQRKYPTIPGSKFVVVPMGFDPAGFEGLEAVLAAKFVVTHLGFFYGPRSPGPFLEAVGQCLRDGLLPRDMVEVRLLGGFDVEAEAVTKDLIARYSMADIVRAEGVVAYIDGLRHLLASAVLLLVTDSSWGGRHLVPTKLYEYLAAGRPILALAPDGPAAELVAEMDAGIIVPPDDVAGIRRALVRLYERWREGAQMMATPRNLEKFTWQGIAGQLVRLLEG